MSGNFIVSGLQKREVSRYSGGINTRQLLEVAFGTVLIVHYKQAVHYSGCPLRGVPLYYKNSILR